MEMKNIALRLLDTLKCMKSKPNVRPAATMVKCSLKHSLNNNFQGSLALWWLDQKTNNSNYLLEK